MPSAVEKHSHVPSIIYTNCVILPNKAHCARAVRKWVAPVILSNDSGQVIGSKVGSLLLRWKFIKLNSFRTRKSFRILLFQNVNGHSVSPLFLFLLEDSVIDNGHSLRQSITICDHCGEEWGNSPCLDVNRAINYRFCFAPVSLSIAQVNVWVSVLFCV